jgi:hypothetical protein
VAAVITADQRRQRLRSILTTWIRNWATPGNTGTGTQIQLTAPVDKDVGVARHPDQCLGRYRMANTDGQLCWLSLHATAPQKPAASSDVNEAYAERRKINLIHRPCHVWWCVWVRNRITAGAIAPRMPLHVMPLRGANGIPVTKWTSGVVEGVDHVRRYGL